MSEPLAKAQRQAILGVLREALLQSRYLTLHALRKGTMDHGRLIEFLFDLTDAVRDIPEALEGRKFNETFLLKSFRSFDDKWEREWRPTANLQAIYRNLERGPK